MAKQTINIGSAPNDGQGSTLRAGGDLINDNFNEIYTAFGDGSNLSSGFITGKQEGTNFTSSMLIGHGTTGTLSSAENNIGVGTTAPTATGTMYAYREGYASNDGVITEDNENLNFDLLLRYVINPWSAFYVGYNSNQSNFDIVEMEGERELVVANELRQDGDQIFVKFSYLFQR